MLRGFESHTRCQTKGLNIHMNDFLIFLVVYLYVICGMTIHKFGEFDSKDNNLTKITLISVAIFWPIVMPIAVILLNSEHSGGDSDEQ